MLTTLAALRELGIEPTLDASSTDANVPLALGIPAVCIGLTRGGHAHRNDEYIELAPNGRGMRPVPVPSSSPGWLVSLASRRSSVVGVVRKPRGHAAWRIPHPALVLCCSTWAIRS